ncbi:hypothetical protein D9M71_673760 [compost metagenome]
MGTTPVDNQLEPLGLDRLAPQVDQAVGHFIQRLLRRHAGVFALSAGQHQESLYQLAHFFTGAGNSLDLGKAALVDPGVFQQQLAGTGQHHQGRAQFMADVTGEHALTGQRLAQPAEGSVEGHGQLTHFIGRIIRRQWRCQTQ